MQLVFVIVKENALLLVLKALLRLFMSFALLLFFKPVRQTLRALFRLLARNSTCVVLTG